MKRPLVWLLVCFFLGACQARGQPTAIQASMEAEVAQQIERLDPKHSPSVRREALFWIDQRKEREQLEKAVPALERCVRSDPETEIRSRAIVTLARLELQRRRPCPVVLIEMMLDKTDEVRWQAGVWVAQFQELAPGSAPLLLRGARSDNQDVRMNILFPLGKAARKEKTLLAVIRDATKDKDWDVRDCAYLALYHATDQLDDLLMYMARERAAVHAAGPVRKDEAAEAKRLREKRNLRMIGGATLMCRWLDARPKDVARVLGKMLDDDAASERRAAALLLADFAGMNRTMRNASGGKNAPDDVARVNDYFVENTPEEQAARAAKLAKQLAELRFVDRLQRLAAGDAERDVRAAAGAALERIHWKPGKP